MNSEDPMKSNAPSKLDFALWAFTAMVLGIILQVAATIEYILQNGHLLWLFGAILATIMVANPLSKDGEEEQD